jgi:ribosomal protein S17E
VTDDEFSRNDHGLITTTATSSKKIKNKLDGLTNVCYYVVELQYFLYKQIVKYN